MFHVKRPASLIRLSGPSVGGVPEGKTKPEPTKCFT